VTLAEKKKSWELALHSKADVTLEKWSLNKRRAPFEEIFGVQLEITEN